MSGLVPLKSDYEQSFPHLLDDFESVIQAEAASIVNDEMPVEKLYGQLPQLVGGYEVLAQVGRDLVSVYYDAYQISLARKVRFRVLLFASEHTVSKALAIANLEHPCFENVIDVLSLPSVCIVVSQPEQGESVAEILHSRPESVSMRQSVRWVRDAADSLLTLHRHDVEHLDVSPYKLIARHSGGGVLVEPNIAYPLDAVLGASSTEFSDQMPFPYRCIESDRPNSRNRRNDDVVALGLVLFVLMTKISLDSFYLNSPLPGEAMRLKTLIQSQLDYCSEVDPVLRALCHRATLGVIDDVDPCDLLALRNGLLEWEKQDDSRLVRESIIHDKHADSPGKPIARGFPWFSKQ